jgi:TrmH family RNA methyltransferase
MISDNAVKLIRSLALKKYRYKHNLFKAEGEKLIFDILNSGFSGVKSIMVTPALMAENNELLSKYEKSLLVCDKSEFSKISNLDSLPDIILIGEIPQRYEINMQGLGQGIHLYLDQIQDPGNVGTIFRNAEWFGISSIGLSVGCADFVHPKVIQASMGSFCRMPSWEGELPEKLMMKENTFAADLSGSSIYDISLPANGLLIIGSEGQGISIRTKVNQFIKIPAYTKVLNSLNAANATAVILSEWRRQLSKSDSQQATW